jgi:hypothetical protein
MSGSLQLREYPREIVPLSCPKCGRAGQYRKQILIERYGTDIQYVGVVPTSIHSTSNSAERAGQIGATIGIRPDGSPAQDPFLLVGSMKRDQGKGSTARSNAAVRICFLHNLVGQLRTRNMPRSSFNFSRPLCGLFLGETMSKGKWAFRPTDLKRAIKAAPVWSRTNSGITQNPTDRLASQPPPSRRARIDPRSRSLVPA